MDSPPLLTPSLFLPVFPHFFHSFIPPITQVFELHLCRSLCLTLDFETADSMVRLNPQDRPGVETLSKVSCAYNEMSRPQQIRITRKMQAKLSSKEFLHH